MEPDPVVASTSLDQRYRIAPTLRKTVGQHAAGGPGSGDDEVERLGWVLYWHCVTVAAMATSPSCFFPNL